MGDFVLRTLTVEDVDTYVTRRKRDRAGTPLINQDLKWWSSLLSSARFWGCGVTRNVVKEYPRKGLPLAQERDRWCTPEEADRLLEACRTDDQRRFVILALFTGMRHRELLGLRWDEIDMSGRIITLGGIRTKSKKARVIPLVDRSYDTLRDTPIDQRKGHLFPGRDRSKCMTSYSETWRGIRRRAKLPDVRIHDLRHTFASWWLQNGGSELILQRALGHASLKQTQRYAHASLLALQQASSVLNNVTLRDTLSINYRPPGSGTELEVSTLA